MAFTLETYSQNEELTANQFLSALPSSVVGSFLSASANELPRVRHESELLRFLDHDPGEPLESYFSDVLGRATPEEFDAVQKLCATALRAADAMQQRPVSPRFALIDALHLSRVARTVVGPDDPIVTLTLGDSASFYALLQALDGGTVESVAFSQASYLVQSKLFAAHEIARPQLPAPKLHSWWQWLAHSDQTAARVITVDASILTLSEEAVMFTLGKAAQSLLSSGSDRVGALVCHLSAAQNFSAWLPFWPLARSAGFEQLHFDRRSVVLIPRALEHHAQALSARLRGQVSPDPLDLVIPFSHFETLLLLLGEL